MKLTDLATAGGCAAKYSAARLEELLRGFVPAEAENLLVGLDPADDAAVYRLDDERALVFTIDFFPPIVDDPDDFGAIAATNALNDVFAMGGQPLLALSVAAFPEELPIETGARRSSTAQTGRCAQPVRFSPVDTRSATRSRSTVSPSSARSRPTGSGRKRAPAPGDALYLTKPLGTALVLGGAKRGLADPAEAVRWMRTLNRDAADVVRTIGPNAVTDVTGFGLAGHAHEMATRSGVRIVLDADASARARRGARGGPSGVSTAGTRNNREYAAVEIGDVAPELVELAHDPQTAGGLLVSLPSEKGMALEAEFARAELFLARIGARRAWRRRRARLKIASPAKDALAPLDEIALELLQRRKPAPHESDLRLEMRQRLVEERALFLAATRSPRSGAGCRRATSSATIIERSSSSERPSRSRSRFSSRTRSTSASV